MENFEQFVERSWPQRDALRTKNKPIAPDPTKPSWKKQVKLDMDAADREKLPPSPGSREDLARPFQNPETHLKSQQAWSEFKPEVQGPSGDFENVHGAQGTQYQKADQMNKRFDSEGKEIQNQFKDSIQEYVGRVIRNGQSKAVLLMLGKKGEGTSNQINLIGLLGRNAVKNIHPGVVDVKRDPKASTPKDDPNKYRDHEPTRTPPKWLDVPGPEKAVDLESMLADWSPEDHVSDVEQAGADQFDDEGGDREEQSPEDGEFPIIPSRDKEEDTAPGDSFEDYVMPRALTHTPDAEEEPDAEERLKRLTNAPDAEAEEEPKRLTHAPDDEEEEQSAIKVNLTGPDGRKHTMADLDFHGHMLRPVEDDEMDRIIDLTRAGIRLISDPETFAAAKRVQDRHDKLGYSQLSDKEQEWLKQIGETGKPKKRGFLDSYDWANNHDDVQVMLEKFLSRG